MKKSSSPKAIQTCVITWEAEDIFDAIETAAEFGHRFPCHVLVDLDEYGINCDSGAGCMIFSTKRLTAKQIAKALADDGLVPDDED